MMRATTLTLVGCAIFAASTIAPFQARADNNVTISGAVTEPNFVMKWMSVGSNGLETPVLLDQATVRFNGQDANIYRLMGTPTVVVTGTMMGGLLEASTVTITSGPRARLQASSYTDMAVPAFAPGDLAPRPVSFSEPNGPGPLTADNHATTEAGGASGVALQAGKVHRTRRHH